ncbi:Gfo/Idh/MocA family oxidoreductase [Rhodospirillaceae bacterium KN72]|uniref:Gfo/Idh/MocA family oxidoreductase n=1 Tax=Pacificispira spongiicola TaxID=2729598 RepID=A0A7Y0E309_9PROT|nr:Gfo/Idh/MocA family oxidoreductase [Pacificispira spongiicola]NMM46322.1 Gfo/Idh/MocA family oxidoreductase [Pacificispira spongiicola]
MAKPLKVGVIGLGVGERHIVGYQAIDGVEVTACCDTDPAKMAAVAERRGVPHLHKDYRTLIADPSIDAVSICSYDDAHVDQAVAAFEAGKHVFCEKPIALDRAGLDRVIRAWSDSGKRISSNLILRQSPRFKAVRDMVRAGEFGDLHYMEGDYIHQILWKITEGWRGKMDFYCVTYGGGIHLIDLMRWIAGEEVTEVTAMAAKKVTRDSTFPYPDTMTSLLRFDSDLMAKSTTSFAPQRRQIHTLNIYGTKLSFENANGPARLYRGDQPEDEEVFDVPYPAIEKGDLLPDFIDAIREDREPIVGARDVFEVMNICLSAWESADNGKAVPVARVV